MSLLLLFRSGWGTTSAGLNLAAALNDLLPPLQSASFAESVFWTEAELYAFADEGAKRLARVAGGFVERDATTTLVVGTAGYALPARHLSTLHMSLGSAALLPRTPEELESLDSDWPNTASETVGAWVNDPGVESFRVYPKPSGAAAGALAGILHRYPVEVTASAAVIQAPVCLREYWFFHVMGEARGKESKAAMPEVAAWCRRMTAFLEGVSREYWGGAG